MNPGADGSPVFAFEIQLEPASGAAHAGFGEITCVALLLELVVAAELASGVESAFAFHTQPLTATSVITSPNFFTICCLRKNKRDVLAEIASNHTGIMQVGRQLVACTHSTYQPRSSSAVNWFSPEWQSCVWSLTSHTCATLFVISDTWRQPHLEPLPAWTFARRVSLFLRRSLRAAAVRRGD
jgi:hypothetical protein